MILEPAFVPQRRRRSKLSAEGIFRAVEPTNFQEKEGEVEVVHRRRSAETAAHDTGASQPRGNKSTGRLSAIAGSSNTVPQGLQGVRSWQYEAPSDDIAVTNLEQNPTESTEEKIRTKLCPCQEIV